MAEGMLPRVREFYTLCERLDSISALQARLCQEEMDLDVLEQDTMFVIEISPNGGPYKGGIFKFAVGLFKLLELKCLTPVRSLLQSCRSGW